VSRFSRSCQAIDWRRTLPPCRNRFEVIEDASARPCRYRSRARYRVSLVCDDSLGFVSGKDESHQTKRQGPARRDKPESRGDPPHGIRSDLAPALREGQSRAVRVAYENLTESYASTVHAILRYLDLPPSERRKIAPPRLRKQADDVTEDWIQRYHEVKR
jgi:hypothetical protein